MALNRRTSAVLILAASISLFALSCLYAWKAGCTADLKAGTAGDVGSALSADSFAGWAMIAGAICGSLAMWFAKGGSSHTRLLFAASTFVALLAIGWLLLFSIEFQATKACLFSGVTAP